MAYSSPSWLTQAAVFMHTASHQQLPTTDDDDDDDGKAPKRAHMLQTILKSPIVGSGANEPFLARSSDSSPAIQLPYEKDNTTKSMCLVGLVASSLIGVGFIVLGGFVQDGVPIALSSSKTAVGGIRQFTLNQVLKEIIPLAVNITITICTESLGLIHATSLKWALYHENRLEFNANLRLMSFARRSWANSRVTNVIYLLALALCYASSPAILVTLPNEACYNSPEKYTGPALYTVSKSGPLCLGLSLLILCAICTWSLATRKAPTWSTHPLTVLAAAMSEGRLTRRTGRCMRSVHDQSLGNSPTAPQAVQKSAYAAHKDVLKVLIAIGISLVLILIWFASVQGTSGGGIGGGCSWSILPPPIDCGAANIPNNYDQTPCMPAAIYIDAFRSDRTNYTGTDAEFVNSDKTREAGIAAQILFTLVIQSFITAGLHCAELEVTLSRDEAMWRAMASSKGEYANRSSILLTLQSWQSLALLLLKPFIHLVYGLSMTISYTRGLSMQAPQILYLAIAWGVLLVFVLVISLRRPKGPLPATYGHLQTMTNLVDEWSPIIHWGDKGPNGGVAHAGTSSKPLLNVRMDEVYM